MRGTKSPFVRSPRPSPRLLTVLSAAFALVLGCAAGTGQGVSSGYQYFSKPGSSDAWSPKISGWQSRELALPDIAELEAPASVSGSGTVHGATRSGSSLREKYFSLRRAWKRDMAQEVAKWIQREAKGHYRPDGAIDHWATLEETLAANGDDCDGLELLVYHFLRDLGFSDDEVFRGIVYRPSDGQHHMVTLWFESPDDPWVIDPTGAMTTGMPRMSQMPEWVPLKVFSENAEFTVEARASASR